MSDCLRCPVCSCAPFYALWHTRPRVQRAPGIPCALCFEGEDIRICITRAKTRRENNFRRPGEGRGPYAAADIVGNSWSTALLEQHNPVVMGPGPRAQLRTRPG